MDRGVIVGRVALHDDSAGPVMSLASEVTGWETERLAVVARLFVDLRGRRRGIGQMLLERATAEAHSMDRWPVLDVGRQLKGAIPLYESCGWSRAGAVTFQFRDGKALRKADSRVYLGPRPPGR